MQARDEETSLDPDLPDWVLDIEIGAGVAWTQHVKGTDSRLTGLFGFWLAVAIATGQKAEDIEDAAYRAGQAGDPQLLSYLPARQVDEGPEEKTAYEEAVEFLAGFTPWERQRLAWRARAAAGTYLPTVPELIRATAVQARMYIEIEGRDMESLSEWLNRLPENAGSRYRMQATAEWDAHWQGQRGHSAHESHDEVLELAVSRALGVEIPGV